jgi:hypothetical protein
MSGFAFRRPTTPFAIDVRGDCAAASSVRIFAWSASVVLGDAVGAVGDSSNR